MGFSAGTLGNLSLIGQATGAVTSAVGSYTSSRVQQANLGAQAAIADTNARIAELGAQAELRAGEQQIAALTLKAGQLKSSQRARLAANGVALDTGSAAEIQQGTEMMKNLDVATTEINAARAAFGQRVQAANYTAQAGMARANADAISPFMNATTTLLGGATRVADSWYRLKGTQTGGGTLAGNGDALGALIELNGWSS